MILTDESHPPQEDESSWEKNREKDLRQPESNPDEVANLLAERDLFAGANLFDEREIRRGLATVWIWRRIRVRITTIC